ncbi:unnamed protein product, partial [Brassica rapa subsp. trilocularis]
ARARGGEKHNKGRQAEFERQHSLFADSSIFLSITLTRLSHIKLWKSFTVMLVPEDCESSKSLKTKLTVSTSHISVRLIGTDVSSLDDVTSGEPFLE